MEENNQNIRNGEEDSQSVEVEQIPDQPETSEESETEKIMDQPETAEKPETEQKKMEYTGEYGNAVEASESEPSSVYSYSYRDHPQEATRSGDYHASDYANAGTSDAGRQDGGESTPQNMAERQTAQGADEWQSSRPQEDAGRDNSSSGRDERSRLTWKKVGACAVLAAIFGVIAAACFQGVCYFSDRVLGTNKSAVNAPIGYTTDQVDYAQGATMAAVGTTDVSSIVSRTMPSIVAITSTQEGRNYYDLFGQYSQESTSCGSGFIVGKNETELLIATNNHVIKDAKTISVQFFDESVYEAKTKGTDASADLAVIAVKLADIKSETVKSIRISKLGDSTEAKVGEMVVAIGNALGYGQSVTVGYISAKDREIQAAADDRSSENSLKVIQTDAAINPGNSGGALINLRGEVIGINSAKISDSSVEGVGYAIPISEATLIIDELMNKEILTEEQKGYLGISGRTVSEEALSFHMPAGVYVEEVAKGGAADKGGIQKGDVITAINDIKVTTIESLKEKANGYKKGTKVTITLQRNADGSYVEKKIEVTLQGQDSLDSIPTATPRGNGRNDGSGGEYGDDGSDEEEIPDSDNGSIWDDWFPFGFGY